MSRRSSWKTLLPAIALLNLVMDVMSSLLGAGELWWTLGDLPFTFVACAYALAPIGSDCLLVDLVLVLLIGSANYTDFLAAMEKDVELGESSTCRGVMATMWFPTLLCCSFFAGVHSLGIFTLWVLSMACCMVVSNSAMANEMMVSISLLAAGCMALEFIIALLYCEWQSQRQCNQRILDGATDGFGVVDCQSGLVLEASPKMLKTMGKDDLVGQPLWSVLDVRDHPAVARFLGDPSRDQHPVDVLVTCCWSSRLQLDLRMVPYRLDGTHIGFCVQKAGEAREYCSAVAELEAGSVEPPLDYEGPLEQPQPQQQQEPLLELQQEPLRELQMLEQKPNQLVGSRQSMQIAEDAAEGAVADSFKADNGICRCAHDRMSSDGALQAFSLPHLMPAGLKKLGTMSLSSWTVSSEADNNMDSSTKGSAKDAAKKPEMRTFAVQVDLIGTPKPPAPLSASTATLPAQAEAKERKRQKRISKAAVVEGRSRIPGFLATPRSTHGNALRQVVQHCNLSGKGCCPHHIAWMGTQRLVAEELNQSCRPLLPCMDWQCPVCFATNDFDDPEDHELEELLCTLCHQLVQPVHQSLNTSAPPEVEPEASGESSDIESASHTSSDASLHEVLAPLDSEPCPHQ
eukprot:CAMPEP_0178382440 /NCGR_PEP_ID=MMETSP0689_2-20121128/6493_1 /TAXON_ID=160604 /ORGANISM="Amphidinium massartii, Strain CS-259" /LENGTH=628 /DNA_ID=CAMNT_0020002641 /DNA_START=143 /DNA_END=2026 /DNA_ORIENTATION=-